MRTKLGACLEFYRAACKHSSLCMAWERKTVWPSGLRRWLKAPVRKGVGSNPTAVTAAMERERERGEGGERGMRERRERGKGEKREKSEGCPLLPATGARHCCCCCFLVFCFPACVCSCCCGRVPLFEPTRPQGRPSAEGTHQLSFDGAAARKKRAQRC